MTLIIQKPTGAKLVLRTGWQPMDADAAAYITAVETADTEPLEERTKIAIDNFVLGCKADGVWSAIKASCILAGARTKEGAIVPLSNTSGVAPTLNGTAGGWNYLRKTGLQGNATDNYIDSGRNNNADPQDSAHLSVFLSSALGDVTAAIGSQTTIQSLIFRSGSNMDARLNSNTIAFTGEGASTGFVGVSRNSPTQLIRRAGSATLPATNNSTGRSNQNYYVFSRNFNGSPNIHTGARLAFYSIGESLDLALLDARVTDLINAFAAAIP
jgi:hypothetical protein